MTYNKEDWISFNGETNAVDDLEKACWFLKRTKENPRNWKWVILCTYSSLYEFAICALKGTTYMRVVEKKKNGEESLVDFQTALRRCQQDEFMKMTIESRTLKLTPLEQQSITRLRTEFRNNFIHYVPIIWAIEIHLISKTIYDSLGIIRFLALESGNYVHLSTLQKKNRSEG